MIPRLLTALPDRSFTALIAIVGAVGYVFAVRLPSLGYNLHIYATVGSFVNKTGQLPLPSDQVGSYGISGYYADFPAVSLRIYQLLSLGGEVPNRFVWAAYFILPLTIVLAVTAAQGPRLGLELPVARALAVTGLVAGVIVARFYEDKAFLLWLPLIVFLLASTAPYVYAVAIGFLGGWTGLLPLAPLYAAIRQSKRTSLLFTLSLFSSAASLLFAGSLVFTLVQNRLERESGSTFWFGFWRYLPSLDHSSFRTFVAIAACLVALVAFQRRWLSLPAAVGASMVISLSASSNFQHTRIWMVLPLVVFLLPSVRSQLWFLFGLLAWSLIPLIDFLGLGYVFAGVGISPAQELFLVIFTNGPVFLTYGLFVAAIIRGIRLAAPRGIGPCCPDSSMYAQVTKDPLS